MKSTDRPSPLALFAAALATAFLPLAAAAADTPFDGKSLEGWKFKNNPDKAKWKVGVPGLSEENPKQLALLIGGQGGELAIVNLASDHGDSVDLYSEKKWGDCRIELEVMVPRGSNSGIYVMGEYEIQILDSWGREKLGNGDMGAIYGAAPPKENACKKPGEWQKYVIDFVAPRFNSEGEKTRNARFRRVELNGVVLHRNIEMKGPTPSGVTGREAPEGPIMFQGDHGPVAYRNIQVTPR